jgi:ABC-2 type transport system ATP-binding protein
MTVRAYLDFIFEMKKVKTPSRKKHIEGICDMVGISDVYDRVIGHLSKGYKQRVGLAQALIGDPEVLILDEPTIGLDPRQIVEIRNVIRKMGKKRTIILSSHILPEVSAICGRILVISGGMIVADGKPDDLASATSDDYATLSARVVDKQGGARKLISAIDGVRKVKPLGRIEAGSNDFLIECEKGSDLRVKLFRTLAQADYPIIMLRPHKDTLEDIFLKLTQEGIADDSFVQA